MSLSRTTVAQIIGKRAGPPTKQRPDPNTKRGKLYDALLTKAGLSVPVTYLREQSGLSTARVGLEIEPNYILE